MIPGKFSDPVISTSMSSVVRCMCITTSTLSLVELSKGLPSRGEKNTWLTNYFFRKYCHKFSEGHSLWPRFCVYFRHESVPIFLGIPIFFSSKFMVNEIHANPLRSQNALGGGGWG